MRGGGVEGGKEIRGISSDRHIRGDFWLQKLESVKVASWHFFFTIVSLWKTTTICLMSKVMMAPIISTISYFKSLPYFTRCFCCLFRLQMLLKKKWYIIWKAAWPLFNIIRKKCTKIRIMPYINISITLCIMWISMGKISLNVASSNWFPNCMVYSFPKNVWWTQEEKKKTDF